MICQSVISSPVVIRKMICRAILLPPLVVSVPSTSVTRERFVATIRSKLNSLKDGDLSISAYDTAWMALVKDVHGSGTTPQFPSSLRWITENQLPDGSWGDDEVFSAHDRIFNTLACVIALETWNTSPGNVHKGLSFIRENLCKLQDENIAHIPVGFEVVFPSLIETARMLELDVANDRPGCTVLHDICAKRNQKLARIPKELMHDVPTPLLYSLEGMPDLDWKKLLKLQSKDGSFLFSPSSTAFALMQTKDEKCFEYLQTVVKRFDGGAPNSYPMDLCERIWVVDRLERLGISHYFQSEIEEYMNYVYSYWTENGIGWARNSGVPDLDDTAMAFRLLRLRGRDVSSDVFRHFEKNGEFSCFYGQSNEGVTVMFNLLRASQVSFSGETILKQAKQFSSKFLRNKQALNQLADKWVISKDLPSEVGYALDIPWYASLPRIEIRLYLEQYGGENDVWIAKTLYRMSNVSNNTYLELAKLDYNKCQELYQIEWLDVQKWYADCNLGLLSVDNEKGLLQAYFLVASCIFEPDRSGERLAWTKSAVLIGAITTCFEGISNEHHKTFFQEFINKIDPNTSSISQENGDHHLLVLMEALVCTLDNMSLEVLVNHRRDIRHQLRDSWEKLLLLDSKEERQQYEAYLLVQTITLCTSHSLLHLEEDRILLSNPKYECLVSLANFVCYRLLRRCSQQSLTHEKGTNGTIVYEEEEDELDTIESGMQELVKYAFQNSESDSTADREIKQTFLKVVKSYFYVTHCSHETIDLHIAKVLLEKVI